MRDDDEVFGAIAHLAAIGEYRDDVPGRSGVDLDSNGEPMRPMYERRSPEFAAAKARGWIDPLPPLTSAPLAAVEEIEALAGYRLPPLLRRLYLEIGNGGFGPGYGVLGLRGGHTVDRSNAFTALSRRTPGGRAKLPICEWGCGISTELDLEDGQVWGYDPNPAPADVSAWFPQDMTITEWFGKWLDGRLYQPWLTEDAVTGQWRGASDAEYEEAMAELFQP